MNTRRFKFSTGHQKFSILLVIIIAGALLVSYGFNHIENQQRAQDRFLALKESVKANCFRSNILRANTNVNAYAEYRAWISVSKFPEAHAFVHKALEDVLAQTWIPLNNCAVPPSHGVEGYPIPTAVKFSVRVPPPSALIVSAQNP